ncbi:ATP-binding cassette sub-family C member 3-like isoform X3 [Dermacentor andersoni]|uniref:ATP-binding cassette sub-family C member 3-like isoform X3 n=1 Tax=Dermacentor andersoni TaxID=34620 RepID=UPI0024169A13|nr:ATP-binding cassette sub-family C member 3-like isoform X3 [Dermacentor andersoni]
MADTLSCVRLVKFYAWEEAVTQAVSRLRAREGRLLFFSNLLNGFTESLQSCSNSVMMILLLGTYAALNRPVVLTAAHSFSALYMLFIIDMVFKNMPTVFRYGSMVSHGLKRMMKTLTAEEDVIGADVKENLEVRKGAVLLEKCTFCWSGLERGKRKSLGPDTPTLYDVSLDIAPGTLLGVVGLVGSGKSALLAAILGELRRLRGTARVGGRVAYLPQTACIFNMPIRDNVLFGRPMEPYRYHRVLEACDLARDLELLPGGDLTELGEKGDTLSGGQKQRVALARAVYSDSDVYLIDDTLSALDVHTAAKVFARVIGPEGLLRDKTRIMVCSQEAFVKHVDKLLLLSDNRVVPYGSLSELNADAVAPKTLLFGSRQKAPSTAKRRDSGCDALLTVESGVAAQLTSQEIRDTSLTAVELLRSFVTMSGACLPLAVLCILAHAVAVWLFLIGTKAWTDASTAVPFGDVSTTTWVTVLAALCLCDCRLPAVRDRQGGAAGGHRGPGQPRSRRIAGARRRRPGSPRPGRLSRRGGGDGAGVQRAPVPGERVAVADAAASDRDARLDEQRALLRRGRPGVRPLLPARRRRTAAVLGSGGLRAADGPRRCRRGSLRRRRIAAGRFACRLRTVPERARLGPECLHVDFDVAGCCERVLVLLLPECDLLRAGSRVHQATAGRGHWPQRRLT